MYIYGCYMKERGKLLTNTVVTTVMSNFGLYKAFDEQGIGYAKTAVGDKYVYEYMAKNVLPYAPDAWIDESKTKIGYEIPFTRQFYKYIPPRPSEEIFSKIVELKQRENEVMKSLFGEM